MRRKPWARPELAQCPYYVLHAEEKAGHWRECFAHPDAPLYVEFGCGKGGFAITHAIKYSDINYLAFDIKSEMLAVARRKAEPEFAAAEKNPCDNFRLVSHNISQVEHAFTNDDRVDRIYINFCNPWPKGQHRKRRLTYPTLLEKYKAFMAQDAEVWFKTDDDELFEDSVIYFQKSGYEITYITHDLHAEGREDNIMTEHEQMFSSEGIKIKMLIAHAVRGSADNT